MGSSTYILLFWISAAFASSTPSTKYRICVPDLALESCHKMVEQGKSVGVEMVCVAARDRIDCINKIKEHQADFEPADPEDMYIAGKLSDVDFSIFKEIRTKEEPTAPYRYDAVVVIPNDINVKKVQDLKGLRSCHTGIGRNVGYKIPLTKLSNMGVLGPLGDTTLSPRENELKSLSQFFSKSCIVGQWSPDQKINQRLKATYSNLCALCEHPDKCDYPDANSGYEGALRCLTKGGGQVAFTKVIFVKKYFGMAHGNQPAKPNENGAGKYSYFCPDGTRKPITGPPCTWASRPWQGYMADSKLNPQFKELRDQISKLNNLGASKHADWISKVLMLNNATIAVDNAQPETPLKYLEKAKYLDVVEKDVLKPRRVVRLCVVGQTEMSKCETLEKAAYSRDIRPSLTCIKKTTAKECLKAVNEKHADAVIVDPQIAIRGEKDFNLVPIVNEQYNKENKQELVAVVRKGSAVKNFQDLKGKKACTVANDHSGFSGVMKYLLSSKFIQKNSCPYEVSMKEFFSGIQQSDDPTECLIFGQGDVAFVPYSSLHEVKDDVEVLCPKEKKSLDNAVSCGVVTLPPRMVLASKNLTPVQMDEVKHTILSAGQYFAEHPEVFRLFGDYDSKANVIFSNHANGLAPIDGPITAYDEYKKLVKDLASCSA
ncbi:transferrin [Nesidiocoris tenuis]|uniref:Transferrin n=1 Tax=Nesidiocoris tenuis TaxID=355587 RepID=A0ABN7BAQ3_9HEMI|nr:transferrin [Nesidiocoris tenuis]